MKAEPNRLELAFYLRQEPVILAALTGVAILFFLAVSALARVHDSQRSGLAGELASQGVADMNTRRFAPAVEDFRTALEYSPDNGAYELSLAQSLMGLKRYDEAQSYLLNLREREPDNGVVSVELARIAVAQNQEEAAMRYYHSAIYSTWPGNQDQAHQKAQLELIDYLMGIQALPQADAELIELQASVGANTSAQLPLAALFTRVGDQQRALNVYTTALRTDRLNPEALAGAGEAAYALGQYANAERYLREAMAQTPGDTQSATRLQQTETVLLWDPLRQQISPDERDRIALRGFDAAGTRLKRCTTPNPAEQKLMQNWTTLKPQVNDRTLRDNQDLVSTVMNLAFEAERQTANGCGAQTDTDRALLLVANLHPED